MRRRIIVIFSTIFIGAVYWIIESIIDYNIFHKGEQRFIDFLLLSVPPHELYNRLTGLGIFLIFGIIVSIYWRRRQKNLERVDHLNKVLMSIRNINQLISREHNRDRLLNQICRDLIEFRGYYNAFIVLLDDAKKVLAYYEAGLGNAFEPMATKLEKDSIPNCIMEAYGSKKPIIIEKPSEQCLDCILSDKYHNRGAYISRLEHDGEIYGALVASVPLKYISDAEELEYFNEIVSDVSLALNHITTEGERDKFERELRDSRNWLSVTLRSIGDAVIATDREGKITFMNGAASTITEWKREDALGRPLAEVFKIVNEESGENVESPVAKVLNSGIVVGLANHTILITASGRKIPIDDSGAPIKNDDGEIIGVVLVFQDITEKKATERKIRQSEETYRNLFQNAQVGLFRTRIEDGKLLECNERLAEMFLFDSREEMIEKYITSENYYDPEARGRMLKILAEHGEVRGFETPFKRKDNTPIWTRFSAKIYPEEGWIEGVLEDITETHEAQEALKESEYRHRMISDLISDVIYYSDVDDQGNFRIAWYTGDPEKLTGYSYESVENYSELLLKITHPEDAGDMAEYRKRLLENKVSIVEFRIIDASGEVKWVRNSARPIFDSGRGRVTGILGAMQDLTGEKNYVEELRQSREKIAAIFESIDDITYFQNLEAGITSVNDAAARITGYSMEEIQTNPLMWKEIVHPDDVDVITEFFEKNPEGVDFYELSYRLQDKRGDWHWLQSRMRAAHDASGKRIGYYCVDRDVTEQRLAAEALAKSEATLQSIFRAAPIGIGIVTNRIIGWVNDQFTEMTGYRPEEIKGKSARILYPTEEEFERVGIVKHAEVRRSGIGSIITKWKRKDGKIIDVLLSSGAIETENLSAGLVFTALDITDRQRAEEALAAEKERLDVTLRSIGDAVIATDTNGKIVLFNKIAEELTGWSYDEALGQPLGGVFHIINEKTRERCESPVDRVIESNMIVGLANHTVLISKNGNERVIEDSGAPIRNKFGSIIGVVLVFRDVTESRRLQEFASRAQRLETAGRIAGQVAHDFNNLLAPLTAYPDLVRMELPPGHPALKYLDDIERSAEQIADINQQLLTLGRRGHYNQEPLNLNGIILQVLDQLKPLPETLGVALNLSDNIMAIKGGAAQIHRLMLNLVNNAREAMNDIGSLRIKSENFYVEALTGKYGRVPQGEYVKVTIADTGVGMPTEVMAKIFDPFFTTKTSDKRRGSGLGLSVVHAVMEDHNGFIDCSSEPGEGSTFYLYFPITREQVKTAPQSEVFGGTERILVVDDDPLQLEVCSRLLENLGYRAAAVESGEEAVSFIKSNPQDLVILDMIMPNGIDGTETYRRILEIYPEQKAILVSGYAQSERVEEALRLGAGEYIKKPLSIRIIASAVRRELDRNPARK